MRGKRTGTARTTTGLKTKFLERDIQFFSMFDRHWARAAGDTIKITYIVGRGGAANLGDSVLPHNGS